MLPRIALDGPFSATTTSADGATLVVTRDLVSDPLLFVGFGSAVGEFASAMLINEFDDAGASIVSVKLVVAPGGSVKPLQVTTLLLKE